MRAGPAGAGALERLGLPIADRRGTHACALAGSAGHPRRCEVGEPDPHYRRAGQARRFRDLVGAARAPSPPWHSRLPGAGARRWCPVARQRHLCVGRYRVCAADRFRAGRCAALVGGHRAGAGRAFRGRHPAGGWRPTPRAGRRPRASWSNACAPVGRGVAHRRDYVLPVGRRWLARALGCASGRDGRGAGAPRRADRGLRGASLRPVPQIDRRINHLGVRLGARRARGHGRCHARAVGGAVARGSADRGALRHSHRRDRTPGHRIPRAADKPRGPAARPGRRRADLPLVSYGRAGRRASSGGLRTGRSRPHRLRGFGHPSRFARSRRPGSEPPVPRPSAHIAACSCSSPRTAPISSVGRQ